MKESLRSKNFLLIIYLISFLIFYNFPFQEFFKSSFFLDNAQAYVLVVDNNVGSTGYQYMSRGSYIVYTTAANGYIFGRDSDGTCVYWKTTNGGRIWGSPVVIYSGTDCLGLTVWYDRWTPGDTTGNYVHLAFADDSDDDFYYDRLDTSDDSQLGEVNITGANQGGTFAVSNSYSITKSTGGSLYLGTSDNGDSFVIKCNTSCGSATNWTELGTNPMDADEDEVILRPLGNDDLMLVNWDISGHFVRSKVFSSSTALWDTNWSNISTATDNTVYKHAFDVTLNKTNNNLYICLNNTVDFATNDIVTGIYNGSSWATSTARPLDNTRAEGCAMGYDQIKDVIYLAYWEQDADTFSGGSSWATATVNMTSWSTAQAFNFGINQGDYAAPEALTFDLTSNLGVHAVDIETGASDLEAENISEQLIQTSWRWQNDDRTPSTNTNMAAATTTISNVNIGQRLTLNTQVANYGTITTTTIFSLQFTTGDPTLPATTWTDVGASTTISFSYGTSTSGTAITSAVGNTPVGCGFSNGAWYENTNVTGNITLSKDTYTELSFMIHTGNAAANTTYYLRLYNSKGGRALDIYDWHPSLTTVTTDNNTRYSKDNLATLYTATTTLTYYFDNLDHSRGTTSDNIFATTTATANTSPVFNFVKMNSNNSSVITFNWEGQTTLACSTQNIKIDIYNFNSASWETRGVNSTCSANTDFSTSSAINVNFANYYDVNNWTYWRIYQNSSASTPQLRTDNVSITFTSPYALHQTSWRFQNDDNPANNNTNMAAATTTVTNVKIGQRLTANLQIENSGVSATTTSFVLQYCTGGASAQDCSSWITLSTTTPIATASSPLSANSGASITAAIGGTPTSTATWANGEWYEQRATTTSFTLNNDTHTEFAFVIDTHNASVNTTYYLRLYNQGIGSTLDSYYFYPTLTTISSNTKIYTKDNIAALASATTTLTYYLDNLGYANVNSSDNTRESVTSTSQYAEFLFGEKNTNSTDQIDISWEGQSDVACSTKAIYLQSYNIYTSSWVTRSSDTTCSAGSDTTITASVTATISPNYFSNGWTYWRVYQDTTTSILQTDAMTFTFTASGSQSNYVLTQTAYRFQSDDNAPNSNTNMAAVNTALTDVKIGQRLTTVLQIKNTGSLSTTTTYTIQYCTGTDTAATCSSWLNLSTTTPISTASGRSSNNTAITSTLTGNTPTGVTWANGAWFEERATTTSFALTTEYYTEFSFMVSTQSAVANTKYYLRLYNNANNSALDTYDNYPTLTMVSTDNNTRYSRGIPSALPADNSASTFYFDDLEHTRTASSDNTYVTSTATANTYPLFLFAKKHTANSDEIGFSWEGATDLACATANLKLEVYNNSSGAWETKTTDSTCSADTDTTITGSITSSLSSYYDSSYFTYWRLYQDETANTPGLKTDYLAFTFTTPATPTTNTSSPGGSGLPSTIYNTPTPPLNGFSVTINNNAAFTNTLNVTLTLNGGEEAHEMAISNDPNFINIGLEPYQTTKTWIFAPQEGTKTVYVKFYTRYGQASSVVSDSINYSLTATPEQLAPQNPVTMPDQGQSVNLLNYQFLRKTTSQANSLFNNHVQGMILLRVQTHGEAYYITPDSNKVYYLKDGNVAYQIMRQTSLGINEANYALLRTRSRAGEQLRRRLAGKIVLRAHSHGEAYYIHPYTLKVYYLANGSECYKIMREQSLGITDENLGKLINLEL